MRVASLVALALLGIVAYGTIPIAFTCAPGSLGYCGNNFLWSALLLILGFVGFVLALIASIIGIVRALKQRQRRWAVLLIVGGLLALPVGFLLSAMLFSVLGASAVAPLLMIGAGLLLMPVAAYLYASRYPRGMTVVKPLPAVPAGATETSGQRSSRLPLRIALGVIVLIATVFDGILATYDTAQRVHVRFEVSPVVQSFCRDLEARDYTAAIQLLSSGLTTSNDLSEFLTLDSTYGAVQRCSLQGVTSDGFGPSTGYSGAQAHVQIVRQDTCTIILVLSQEGNNWVIEEFGTSDGFTTNFGVPNCEGVFPPAADLMPLDAPTASWLTARGR